MIKEDFTKYKLKPAKELQELVSGKDNILVVSCNKCFKEFVSIAEPEYQEAAEIIKSAGKTVSGYIPVDYLCNQYLTEKILEAYKKEVENSGAVLVIACGLGIQTVSALVNKQTLPGADSLWQNGHHGVTLSAEKCGACGECFLTSTGGICPVVDCAKGLVNGPCGGAKNGKCEVGKHRDCAWELIYNRLDKQGRTKGFVEEAPKFRNYRRNSFKLVDEYVKLIRAKRSEGFYGGLYPFELKELASELPIEIFPEPDTVIIPLSQHAGLVCEPLVKKGDKVLKGQKIGESVKSPISAPVHASVSGEVLEVAPKKHPVLPAPVLSVVIKSDKKQELDASIRPAGTLESLTKEKITEVIRDKGIVGMGGAGFPTAVKLKSPKPLDTVLINGCECEPLLNADYRVMLERPAELILGLRLLMKAAGVSNGIIALEDNKPEAAAKLKELLQNDASIMVEVVKTKYPQGAERMLIKRVLKREVPLGGLPLDVGVVVNNVGTAYAVWDAVYNGAPLIKRVLTVSGESVPKRGNFEVLLGTQLKELVKFCGIKINADEVLKTGGPMMGVSQSDGEAPVIKGTGGLVVVKKHDIVESGPECIKCGRCVEVCPMELKPTFYVLLAQKGKYAEMENHGVMNCIECGCCDNICAAKSSIVEIIKQAKKVIRGKKK